MAKNPPSKPTAAAPSKPAQDRPERPARGPRTKNEAPTRSSADAVGKPPARLKRRTQGGGIKVRAQGDGSSPVVGEYDLKRRRDGDVFVVFDQLDSKTGKVKYTARQIVDASSWMIEVDPSTREHTTTIDEAQALRRQEVLGQKGRVEPDPIGDE